MTDWSNPCEALTAIRSAYYQLVAGERVVRVKLPDREVEFAGPAAIKEMQAEIARLEVECAKATGGNRRRSALRAGYRNQ